MNKNRSQNKQFDGTANTLPVNSTLEQSGSLSLQQANFVNLYDRWKKNYMTDVSRTNERNPA
jgi:hypothetical protein